jgi:hypothetical protein
MRKNIKQLELKLFPKEEVILRIYQCIDESIRKDREKSKKIVKFNN